MSVPLIPPTSAGKAIMYTPHCPVCTTAARVTRQLSDDQIAAALAPQRRDEARHHRMLDQVSRLWPSGGVEVCVCEPCQLGFAWPLVAGDDAFYGVLHERTGYPTSRWEFRETLATLPAEMNRVLDVGAGKGDFLAMLPSGIERHAVEASQSLRDALADREIAAHATIATAPGAFDLVTMFHVLQYFADPVAALRDAAAKLAPGGRLALSLPNALAVGRLDDLRSPPHPLTRWSEPGLRAAAARAGLAVERIAFIPQKASSLLWAAHARSRERGGRAFERVDAMEPSRGRTTLLTLLAIPRLPRIALHASSMLRRAQLYVVLIRVE